MQLERYCKPVPDPEGQRCERFVFSGKCVICEVRVVSAEISALFRRSKNPPNPAICGKKSFTALPGGVAERGPLRPLRGRSPYASRTGGRTHVRPPATIYDPYGVQNRFATE